MKLQLVLRYAAYLANIALLIALVLLAMDSYGDDIFLFILMAVPPVLSFVALYTGPDPEERRLDRLVRKARLRQELQSLQQDDNQE
jgi:peptidoglycan/LPS O-acetylase OafA/YrhL